MSNEAQLTPQNLDEQIAEYHPKLRSFIRARVANIEDADDILQDVFYQLTKTVNAAMNPIEHLSAWLYKVARNTIINNGIKKREEEMPVFRDEDNGNILKDFSEIMFADEALSPSPETEYLRSLVWEELENALAELPPEQREAYELSEIEGFSLKEISEQKGVAVNTLLSRKHYAVLHLRKRLKELYNDLINS
jgi:RNA polymerase sigma factor (sigma-70 family)